MSPPRIVLASAGEPGATLAATARRVLEAVAEVEVEEVASQPGGRADGPAAVGLEAETTCREAGLTLAGDPDDISAELLAALGLDVAVLPVRARPILFRSGPLKKRLISRTDLVLVSALEPTAGSGGRAAAAEGPVPRSARVAFEAAEMRSGRLIAVDPAPGADPDHAWRGAIESFAGEHPDVEVERLAGAEAAETLAGEPDRLDVVLAFGAVGDQLQGQAAGLTGLPQMLPRGLLGGGGLGLFAPFRVTTEGPRAPFANPIGAALAVASLLRYGLGMSREGDWVDDAVDLALESGMRTPDIFSEAVNERRSTGDALANLIVVQLGWLRSNAAAAEAPPGDPDPEAPPGDPDPQAPPGDPDPEAPAGDPSPEMPPRDPAA